MDQLEAVVFGSKSMAIGSITAVLLAVGAPAAQAATGAGVVYAFDTASSTSSTDWSGWDVTGSTYNSVSAAWTVPAVACTTGETSYSADWVGLDGDGSDSVEQTGSSSDCDSGAPTYSAWYEFYPSVSMTLANRVKAGDKITASVAAVTGTDKFKLVLTDATQNWTKTETGESPSGTGASAEIIAEAPSGAERSSSVLPLADFKTVTFSDVLVDGQALGTSDNAEPITMVDSSENPMATVSALSGDSKFTVTWVSSGDSGASTQTGGQSTGQGGGGGFPGGIGDRGGSGYGNGDSYGYGYGYGYGDGYGSTGDIGNTTSSTSNSWTDIIGEGYGAGFGSGNYWQL